MNWHLPVDVICGLFSLGLLGLLKYNFSEFSEKIKSFDSRLTKIESNHHQLEMICHRLENIEAILSKITEVRVVVAHEEHLHVVR